MELDAGNEEESKNDGCVIEVSETEEDEDTNPIAAPLEEVAAADDE
jgi:hypothetical protein